MLVACIRLRRGAFLKLLVLLVPRQMTLDHSGGVKEMTDEQLERGIELIKEMLAQRQVSLAHPGGNLTGFSYMEPTMGAKWLDLLKRIGPRVNHTALMFNPDSSPYSRLFYESIETATTLLAVEAVMAPVHNLNEIEHVITMLEGRPGGGLIVSPDGFTTANRKAIIEVTAKHRMPTVYGVPGAAFDGGLIHYCVDLVDQYQSAVAYVDYILRGGKPADLPVQQPTKFSLVVNLKTAKMLDLSVPPALLAHADEGSSEKARVPITARRRGGLASRGALRRCR